ncbi:hypothetical protein RJ640_027036 [Escallonia rubra]|uniref:Cytochrome P450 n=1 Tax=Escallonia rubra TaxID=112253 RepID=A0AA88QP15_9ASTE|nr:hypothetical protein RJ640_027036 [Escallonia rubra]
MKTHDLIFAQRPYLLASRIISYDSTNIGFAPYGDYWRQLRKICITELLSIKRVQTFRRIREDEVSSLIREISVNEKESLNLSKKIFSLTYGVTARAAFGKKCDDQDVFISLVEQIIEMAAGFCVADMYPSAKFLQVISGLRARLEKVHKKVDKILEKILNEHKERISLATKTGKVEVDDKDLVDA